MTKTVQDGRRFLPAHLLLKVLLKDNFTKADQKVLGLT